MNSLNKLRLVLSGLLFAVLMASCSLNNPVVTDPTPVASLSFYHACPDGPSLYILIDDATINSQLFSFGDFTGYSVSKAGTRAIKFKSSNNLTVLVDTTFTFSDKSTYSIFAINSLANIKALLIHDVGALSTVANTMVRFIHLSPDAPAVTATLVGASGPFFSGGYKEISDFTEMTPKVYTLEIRAQSGGQLLLSTSVPTLPGAYYTVALTGYMTPPANNPNALSAKIIAN